MRGYLVWLHYMLLQYNTLTTIGYSPKPYPREKDLL